MRQTLKERKRQTAEQKSREDEECMEDEIDIAHLVQSFNTFLRLVDQQEGSRARQIERSMVKRVEPLTPAPEGEGEGEGELHPSMETGLLVEPYDLPSGQLAVVFLKPRDRALDPTSWRVAIDWKSVNPWGIFPLPWGQISSVMENADLCDQQELLLLHTPCLNLPVRTSVLEMLFKERPSRPVQGAHEALRFALRMKHLVFHQLSFPDPAEYDPIYRLDAPKAGEAEKETEAPAPVLSNAQRRERTLEIYEEGLSVLNARTHACLQDIPAPDALWGQPWSSLCPEERYCDPRTRILRVFCAYTLAFLELQHCCILRLLAQVDPGRWPALVTPARLVCEDPVPLHHLATSNDEDLSIGVDVEAVRFLDDRQRQHLRLEQQKHFEGQRQLFGTLIPRLQQPPKVEVKVEVDMLKGISENMVRALYDIARIEGILTPLPDEQIDVVDGDQQQQQPAEKSVVTL